MKIYSGTTCPSENLQYFFRHNKFHLQIFFGFCETLKKVNRMRSENFILIMFSLFVSSCSSTRSNKEANIKEDHHGGHHVTWVGPLLLPASGRHSMRVQSSLLMPGATTPAHTHPGPEVLYIVDGQQCTEMPGKAELLSAGQSYVVPAGTIHRGRVIGSKARRILALNLYDAEHPTSHDLENPPQLGTCK